MTSHDRQEDSNSDNESDNSGDLDTHSMDLEEHSEINQSDEEPSESELDSPSSQESDEIFSYEELKEKKIEEIKKIAKNKKILLKGNKETLIQNILLTQNIDDDTFDDILQNLSKSSKNCKAPHHKDYKQFFNGVDLQDSFWYAIQGHHYLKRWQSKLIFSLLEICMVNSYTLYKSKAETTMSDFDMRVSQELCKKSFEI